MIKNILFDLDGTLINTLQNNFNEKYFKNIYKKFVEAGYDGKILSNAVLEGLGAMISNNGNKTNEAVFWDFFESKTKIKKVEIYELFEDFYDCEYNNLNDCVEKIETTRMAVSILKEKGYNLILATNPLFPKVAIEKRAGWGDINCQDFSYITSYENSRYAKPNINYYKEIIKNNNLKVEETMMFGNDLIEDLAVEEIDVPCFIITDNMINLENLNNCTKKGDYNEFLQFINNLPKIN
jgi:FMN phosphatase YigB (HAD superfamily)